MATFWDVVTSSSSLPVQAGTTFWDHLNSQKAPTVQVVASPSVPPPIIYGETLVFVEEDIRVVYDDETINILIPSNNVIVTSETSVDITDEPSPTEQRTL